VAAEVRPYTKMLPDSMENGSSATVMANSMAVADVVTMVGGVMSREVDVPILAARRIGST
jgi:hypothetical protein